MSVFFWSHFMLYVSYDGIDEQVETSDPFSNDTIYETLAECPLCLLLCRMFKSFLDTCFPGRLFRPQRRPLARLKPYFCLPTPLPTRRAGEPLPNQPTSCWGDTLSSTTRTSAPQRVTCPPTSQPVSQAPPTQTEPWKSWKSFEMVSMKMVGNTGSVILYIKCPYIYVH